MVKLSKEVHLIGYSLPEYDNRARELLARNIGKSIPINVCCHNGTDGVIAALKQLGNTHVQPACAVTFEGWVSSMKLG
jgi:hypothetical protein